MMDHIDNDEENDHEISSPLRKKNMTLIHSRSSINSCSTTDATQSNEAMTRSTYKTSTLVLNGRGMQETEFRPSFIHFDHVHINSETKARLMIHNESNEHVQLSIYNAIELKKHDIEFINIIVDEYPLLLNAGQIHEFRIRWKPSCVGRLNLQLLFRCEQYHSQYTLKLYGNCTIPLSSSPTLFQQTDPLVDENKENQALPLKGKSVHTMISKKKEKLKALPFKIYPFSPSKNYQITNTNKTTFKDKLIEESAIKKQEQAFLHWINYELSLLPSHVNHHKTLTKDHSFLQGRRKLREFIRSEEFINTRKKLNTELITKRIHTRLGIDFYFDVGVREKILGLLIFTLDETWIKYGLTLILGERNEGKGKDLLRYYLFEANVSFDSFYDTEDDIEQYLDNNMKVIKKFLLFIYILDHFKICSLLYTPFFTKETETKSVCEIAQKLNELCLQGEGNFIKHLKRIGFVWGYSRNVMEELPNQIHNLAAELRTGLYLGKLFISLTGGDLATDQMKIPDHSSDEEEQRKLSLNNVKLVFNQLEKIGVYEIKTIQPEYIVDGDRTITLKLLWVFIYYFKLPKLIHIPTLYQEILALKSELRVFDSWGGHEESLADNEVIQSEVLKEENNGHISILFEWLSLVSAFCAIKIKDFRISLNDGRVFCSLISYYYPSLLPVSSIYNRQIDHMGLFIKKMKELGGLPNLLNTEELAEAEQRDEKTLIICAAFLSQRLLTQAKEIRALKVIQRTIRAGWREKEHWLSTVKAIAMLSVLWRAWTVRWKVTSDIGSIKSLQMQLKHKCLVKVITRTRNYLPVLQAFCKGVLMRNRIKGLTIHTIVLQCFLRKVTVRRRIQARIIEYGIMKRKWISAILIHSVIKKIQKRAKLWMIHCRIQMQLPLWDPFRRFMMRFTIKFQMRKKIHALQCLQVHVKKNLARRRIEISYQAVLIIQSFCKGSLVLPSELKPRRKTLFLSFGRKSSIMTPDKYDTFIATITHFKSKMTPETLFQLYQMLKLGGLSLILKLKANEGLLVLMLVHLKNSNRSLPSMKSTLLILKIFQKLSYDHDYQREVDPRTDKMMMTQWWRVKETGSVLLDILMHYKDYAFIITQRKALPMMMNKATTVLHKQENKIFRLALNLLMIIFQSLYSKERFLHVLGARSDFDNRWKYFVSSLSMKFPDDMMILNHQKDHGQGLNVKEKLKAKVAGPIILNEINICLQRWI